MPNETFFNEKAWRKENPGHAEPGDDFFDVGGRVEAEAEDRIANSTNLGMAEKLMRRGIEPIHWFRERQLVAVSAVNVVSASEDNSHVELDDMFSFDGTHFAKVMNTRSIADEIIQEQAYEEANRLGSIKEESESEILESDEVAEGSTTPRVRKAGGLDHLLQPGASRSRSPRGWCGRGT